MPTCQDIVTENLGLTNTQIAALLNTPAVTRRDNNLHGYAYLVDLFGRTLAKGFVDTLKNYPGGAFQDIYDILFGSGVDFSNQKTQDQIDALQTAQILDSNTAAALKAIGIWQESQWEVENGRGEVVTTDDVQSLRTAITYAQLRESVDSKWSQTISLLNAGTATKQALTAIWADWE